MAIMKKEMEFFIQTSAVDVRDKIKPASVFDYFQDIAGLHAKELGVSYETIKKDNLAWVILYETYEVINMPPYLDKVIVKTWPKKKGRLEFEREYFMETLEGKPLIKGISNWVLIDINNRTIVRTDRVDYNGEYYEFTNYNEKTKRKIGLDYSKCSDFFESVVTYDDLDHNGHMNNTRYLTHIYNNYDFENRKCYCRHVEISFIKEAKWKDTISIGHYVLEDGRDAYIGKISDEVCFECILTMEEIKND